MASAGKVDVTVKARVKPSVGVSTIAGGTVTLAAYAAAVVAVVQGARDETTISAVVVGTVSLVTVLGGRYAQAIVALLPLVRSSWGGERPAPAAPAAPAAVPRAVAFAPDDEDQGDELHEIFADVPVSDPATIPPDVGDAKVALHGRSAHASSVAPGAVSGLNATQRIKAREMAMQAAYLGLTNAPAVHYTQGAKRWEGIAKKLRAWRGQFPRYCDCSAFATWVLWQGLGHFHVRDIVNGEDWLAGWTGTQLEHGKRVVHENNIKQADLALYDGHVAICVGRRADGTQMVISHGSEAGPFLLPLHYRSDLIEVRRYI